MKHARLTTFVGLVLLLTGLVATGLLGRFTIITVILCVLGILLGSVIFIPRVTRNAQLYLNLGLYSVFFTASLLMFYLVLLRHPATYDATSRRIYSVSDSTRSFLRRLTQPIRITAFLRQDERNVASLLLREYSRYSPHIKYDIRDPFRDVVEARRFGLDVIPGDVFIEKLTTSTEVAERIVRVPKLEEEELTNGIVQALRGRDLVLYFLTGHGELSIEKDNPATLLSGRRTTERNLSWVREQLERSHIKTVSLPLGQRGRIPSDCSALICAAPRLDITTAEKEALRNYLSNGGKAMFLLNPDTPQVGGEARTYLRNLADLLEDYGLILPPELLVMPMAPKGVDIYTIPVQFASHRINPTEGDETLFFDQARPVIPSRTPPDNIIADTLLLSPQTSYRLPIEEFAKALLGGQKVDVSVQPDELASHPIGAAVTLQAPGTAEDKATRIIAVGNGTFLSTELIDQKGWLLFQNSINWLTSSGDLIAIPTREIENTPITLTDGQKQFLFLLLVIIVPALIGLSGLGYTISKRELQ